MSLTLINPNVAQPPTLSFRVYGTPTPQGSKTAIKTKNMRRAVVVDDNRHKLKPWRELVHSAAREAIESSHTWRGLERRTPIKVTATFFFARPKSHYRTGKKDHLLKLNAPELHTNKPDIDKLERALLDSLTSAGAFFDDNQAAQIRSTKRWCPPGVEPGVYVHVEVLHDQIPKTSTVIHEPVNEFVVFDEAGREIDWIDPVLDSTEIKPGVWSINNGLGEYHAVIPDGGRYEIRPLTPTATIESEQAA